MSGFEIIKPGLLTTIQDFGRKGFAYYAIPKSGVMDKNAAKIAQLILGKDEDWPLIECTSMAPTIQFHGATSIAISGADFNWKINNETLPLNALIKVEKGDVLIGQFAKDGLRAYLAINNPLKLDKIYDSYSTYINAGIGGYQGRILKKGDIVEWQTQENDIKNERLIPIKEGPEFHLLSNASKRNLMENVYKIGTDSNRMGIRLKGPKLESSIYQLENSLPVLPGFIQLPPSGLPIIILQDGQISGGYPRIAYVQEKHLSGLNQIPLGGSFRFQIVKKLD
jgi:antagonist of KipI